MIASKPPLQREQVGGSSREYAHYCHWGGQKMKKNNKNESSLESETAFVMLMRRLTRCFLPTVPCQPGFQGYKFSNFR